MTADDTRAQQELARAIANDGWAITPPVVPQLAIDRLVGALESSGNGDERGGVRNLFDTNPAVRELARSDAVRGVAEAVLGPHCFATRVILFDKTPRANWKVVWHQDLTIAVRRRRSPSTTRVAGDGFMTSSAWLSARVSPLTLASEVVLLIP